MGIQSINSPTYSIVEHGRRYRLVRVIGEYNTNKEAITDMYKILNNIETEKEIENKKGVNYK